MPRVTIAQLKRWKVEGKKITMLTAYDYPMAKLLDEAGLDIILVGDSLGMVVLGYETTAPVTMEEMLHHAKAARRGVSRALLVGDMPLCALKSTKFDALHHAKRFAQEALCDAVKIEWKIGMDEVTRAIVAAGIPVMGHVGLTPQTVQEKSEWGMRGKDAESAARLVEQAQALEGAGCFAMVLECLPDLVAREITQRLRIPTIGIGSGAWCDGQVLVTHDLLGLFDRFTPRFAKRYAQLAPLIKRAASSYVQDVRKSVFPAKEHTVSMKPEEFAKLTQLLARA